MSACVSVAKDLAKRPKFESGRSTPLPIPEVSPPEVSPGKKY